jgi:hypothetical protein
MEELYRKIEALTLNEDPLMVAGIMMAQAMKIYKTVLNEDAFKELTSHISETADSISIETPTLN